MKDTASVRSGTTARIERREKLLQASGITSGHEKYPEDSQAFLAAVLEKAADTTPFELIKRLSCSPQSETCVTAMTKSSDAIADWIASWLESGEFWPDESFDYPPL